MNIQLELNALSDEKLKEVYEQLLRMEKSGGTDEQPLRTFLDSTPNPLLIVPMTIYKTMADRWYRR